MSLSTLRPPPLLLLTPLVAQTAFTTLALLEPLSFHPFLDASISPSSLRTWFNLFVWRAFYAVIGLGAVSAGVGGRTSSVLGGWGNSSGKFYALGAIFSASHFVFGPWVAQIIDRLCNARPFPSSGTLLEPTWGVSPPDASIGSSNLRNERERGELETKDELRRWLRLHYTRTLLTDIPALVLFFKGAVAVFGR